MHHAIVSSCGLCVPSSRAEAGESCPGIPVAYGRGAEGKKEARGAGLMLQCALKWELLSWGDVLRHRFFGGHLHRFGHVRRRILRRIRYRRGLGVRLLLHRLLF